MAQESSLVVRARQLAQSQAGGNYLAWAMNLLTLIEKYLGARA